MSESAGSIILMQRYTGMRTVRRVGIGGESRGSGASRSGADGTPVVTSGLPLVDKVIIMG